MPPSALLAALTDWYLPRPFKSLVIDAAQQLAPEFPSSQTRAVVADIANRTAALAAARKALFDAARAEQ